MFEEVKKLNKKHAVRLAISALIAIAIAVATLFFTVTKVKHTQYCGKCHSDVTFNNKCYNVLSGNIACIDCHAPENRSMKVMAVEMADERCTSELCHPLQKLSETAIRFKKTKDFRHATHTKHFPGNLTLRCVSCHSHSNSGKHFETDADTCNICHFTGMQQALLTREKQPISECTLCHTPVDKTIQIYGNTFNHIAYEERKNVGCSDCHFAVVQGNGAVVRENCYVCHQTIQEKYTAPDMHDIHIMNHKTACVSCHNTITHTAIKKNGVVLSNIPNRTFDLSLYKTQWMAMAGTGGAGIADEADPMFIATLNCSACHKDVLLSKVAPEVCNNCHDSGFDKIVSEQISFVSKRMRLLKLLLKRAKKLPLPNAGHVITEAESNYYFIKEDGSNGAHNIKYVKDLLEYSITKLNQVLQEST